MNKLPWYREGLRFKCTGCGACCTGEPGYIWVNQAEIKAMAEVLGISPEKFERNFVRPEGRRRTLKERANGDCVLLDHKTSRCTVYAVRPRQCRSWPFWSSNLRSVETWEQTCEECPGAGKGTKIALDEIERCRGMIQI
jgi:Fe-S-cluster containining protein